MITRFFDSLRDLNTAIISNGPSSYRPEEGDLVFLRDTNQIKVFVSRVINGVPQSRFEAVNDERITGLQIENRLDALENTATQSNEITSGTVLNILEGELVGNIETSTNNPSVKVFNGTDINYRYTSVSGGETIEGGVDNGQHTIIHHSTVGEVTITFTPIFGGTGTTRSSQRIVLESAGG